MSKKQGEQTLLFGVPPVIAGTAAIGGPMEGEGLLKDYFHYIMEDTLHGEDSWEKCESFMLEWVASHAAQSLPGGIDNVDCLLAGDLLNQLMATHFAMRSLGRPFIGLYGACSTMAMSIMLGSCLIDGGFFNRVVGCASSHHDAAERQYRFPTELGVQRPPSAQWTVTGAGAAALAASGDGPLVTAATIGKVVDMGLKDPNNMGPAMAPAAVETLYSHLSDLNRQPDYYDMIYTGDLGIVGKTLVIEMMREKGVEISANYEDCGCMIYREDQDAHAGASGCASSAVAFCGYIYQMLLQKKLQKILLIGTGSLHSITSYQQKESIPCIAHAVAIEI
ncbi:MAG: stage V sporulation protein AD [Sporomusaceae bacterium]|nr:stage V sporulation protein AD [Sporomusaceae bacterium]